MKFYITDAFTEELFGGNPAGVVLIPDGEDYPSDEIMVKTAAELRYSETAFIRQLGPKEFQARYFTPAAEVDLCGHATIASFYSLMKDGIISSGDEILVHTLAGDIEIGVSEDYLLMDMAEPKHIYTIADAIEVDRLYEIMGSEFDQSLGLYPMIITTGLPDIMMPVATRAELDNLNPNFDALTQLSKAYKVTGVHAFTLDSEDNEGKDYPAESVTCHARNFAPLYDIDEEAATGTSNGALTYYLCLNEKLCPQGECRVIQGEAMNRPSLIRTTIDAGETCRIRVGGSALVLAKGEINI